MTYFTAQLWREMNQKDHNICERAHKQWRENSLHYRNYFETIKHHIPKRLRVKMERANGFHDFEISGLSIRYIRKLYICRIELFDGHECFCLELSGLVKAKIDIESFEKCILGRLRWGYHEFKLTEAKTLQLSILCDIENELLFEFKKVVLKSS